MIILFDDPPRGDLCAGGNGAVGAGPVGAPAGPGRLSNLHGVRPRSLIADEIGLPDIPDPLGQRRDDARIAAHGCYLQPPGEVAELTGAHRIVGRKVAQLFRHGHRLLRQLNEIAEGRTSSKGGAA